MITLAVSNQKGGVGKTTTAAALGGLLANNGRRVLLVDLDPQSSLTGIFGIDAAGRSLAEVIGGAEPGDLTIPDILQEARPGLAIAPADITLSRCELGLVSRIGRELALREALDQVRGSFDVVIIDCPPSLGLLAVNGLAAARGVIACTLPAAADLRGLRLFLNTLEKIRPINKGLALAGIVVTQYNGRTNAHQEALELIQRAGLPLWMPPIPQSVRVQEAQARRVELSSYDPSGRAMSAYQELSEELLQWLQRNETSKMTP